MGFSCFPTATTYNYNIQEKLLILIFRWFSIFGINLAKYVFIVATT